jgi:cyclopropane-fatty-acyl-phospholipid synthase
LERIMDPIRLAETGWLPRWLLHAGIHVGFAFGLRRQYAVPLDERCAARRELLRRFDQAPIAIRTVDPNQQHYELPTAFFRRVLGPWLKYSSCYWPKGVETLAQAEEAMLALTCQRAGIEDGMTVLDLGCGWGSLTLWIASHYPHCHVVATSNSRTQTAYIREQAEARGLSHVQTRVTDVSAENALLALGALTPGGSYDRIVSVEMFEHMKNYRRLLACLAALLRPGGRLFVHHFCHRELLYEFDADGDQIADDWMATHFFSGGTMPSADLLPRYQEDLRLIDTWCVGGLHYARTLRAWLDRFDAQRDEIRALMAETYGAAEATRWLMRWWLFFAVCERIFRHRRGQEYFVGHYLFERPSS